MPWLAAVFLFLVPVVLTPGLLFYYDITPKLALLMLAAALALTAAAGELASWAAFWKTRWGRVSLLAAAGSIAFALLSALRSSDRELAWYGSNWRRMGALAECAIILAAFWTAQYAIRSQRSLLILLRAICGAGLLTAVYGVAQYFGWDPILPPSAYQAGEGIYQIVRPPGTLGHSDYFAAFLLWPVFAGLALAVTERSPRWKWFAAVSAAASSIAIVLSGTRGALLGLLCGLAVQILLRPPNLRRTAAACLAAVVVFAGFYASPWGERLRARVHWAQEEPAGGARLLLWRDSLTMTAKRPLTGFGPDVFAGAFPKFQSVALEQAFPDFYHESPHNLPVDTLAGVGILGLLALSAVVLAGIAGGIRGRRTNFALSLALLPALIASLVAHQFAVLIAPTAFYFYTGAAALAGSGAVDIAPARIPRIWRGAALILGMTGAVFFAVSAYRLVTEDGLLALAQRRLDQGRLSDAVLAYRAALARPTAGVSADLYFSRRWSKIAGASSAAMPKFYYSQLAAGAASRATRQPEELQNAWFNLAVLAAARNDPSGTEYALRAAINAAPNWYKPHWILARLLAARGLSAEAAQEAGRALELNGAKDAEVAATIGKLFRSGSPSP